MTKNNPPDGGPQPPSAPSMSAVAEAEETAARQRRLRRQLFGSWFAVLALYVVIVGVVGFGTAHPSGRRLTVAAYVSAAAILVLALWFIVLSWQVLTLSEGSQQGSQAAGSVVREGMRGLLVGTDGRTSTSKSQALLWTLLVAFALAYIASRSMLNPAEHFQCLADKDINCVPGDTWQVYLILLGLPTGALVVAKGVTASKVAGGTLQKVTSEEGASLADLTTDDAKNTDLVDVQYLIFNLIAMLWFVMAFAQKGRLPEIPDVLLALTGTAAGVYVLNKGLLNNKPAITSITPSAVLPGETITIAGRNLLVGPKKDGWCTVNVGGQSCYPLAQQCHPGNGSGPDKITLPIPPTVAAGADGRVAVSVVTATQVQTDSFQVSVPALEVIGWTDVGHSRLRVEGVATKTETRPDGTPTSPPAVEVLVNSTTYQARATGTDGKELVLELPQGTPTSNVQVSLRQGSRSSQTVTLTTWT